MRIWGTSGYNSPDLLVLTISLFIMKFRHLTFLATAALAVRLWQKRRIFRLFDAAERFHNFRHMEELFPARRIQRGGDVFAFGRAERDFSNFTFPHLHDGQPRHLEEFLQRTCTTGFLIIHKDQILHERYMNGATAESRHLSWSVGKSFVSALVGFAVAEGHIGSVDEPITQYVPELRGSGYDGVPIKHILQMSSGIYFKEDYRVSLFSEINKFMFALYVLGIPLERYIANLRSHQPSGQFNQYRSADTEALGMLLRGVTGRPLTAYLEEKIWRPLGMEADALWLLDAHGVEVALGCLNCTTRDYARFGRLYLHEGNWNGRQLLPAQWVRDSVTADAPHLQPGAHNLSDYHLGYGYQWWLPENPQGDFVAIGIWGQYIYVHPAKQLIIVKNSVDPDHEIHDDETISLFRALAATF